MQSYEFITIEEVADRLHVSRATLFNWMQRGVFIQGKHFFKQGRVLRFIWGDDLVSTLMGNCLEKKEIIPVTKPISKKNDSPLNWDY